MRGFFGFNGLNLGRTGWLSETQPKFGLSAQVVRFFLMFAVLGLLTLCVACGGAASAGAGTGIISPPPPPPPATTVTQVRIGDAPVDRVLEYSVGIGSPIVLTPSGGGANVNVTVGTPNRLELSHMSGNQEPLTIQSVPQGTYSSAAITILAPILQFVLNPKLDPTITGAATQTITVTFNPPLTIGTSPGVLNIDINAANSLTFDPVSGAPTGFNFGPSSFNITTNPIAAAAQEEDIDGEIEDMAGMVSSVSGTSFTMTAGQSGAQLTFATDGTTLFDAPLTGVSSLPNQIVKVEGVTRADGTLFAQEVEGLEANSGSEVEGYLVGVIYDASANAMTLTMGAQDGSGNGMQNSDIGAGFNVDVTGLAANKYRIAMGKIDTTGLTVPGPVFPFDAKSIHGGQHVEIESLSAVPIASATITADQVKLKQQSLTGQVTAMSGTAAPRTITMTLPPDSAVLIQSKVASPSVTVFEQPGTDDRLTAINIGDTIRVRGLLFNTSTGFNMIARRIIAP